MRNNLLVLGAILLMTVLIRVPFTTHEIGYDSFRTHWMAQSISSEGTAKWLVHPASHFGLYPYSYPSFLPYILVILSTVLGITLETAILVFSWFLGFSGVLFMFIFARTISSRIEVAYLSAFVFAASPIFLAFTVWSASTRNLFIVLIPLLLYLILRFYNTRNTIYLGLSLLFFLIEALTHRLFITLILFIIVPFILSMIYWRFRSKPYLQFLEKKLMLIIPAAFILLFLAQFSRIPFYCNLQHNYLDGFLFDAGTHQDYLGCNLNRTVLFINLILDYVSRNGLPFLFAPLCLLSWLILFKKGTYRFWHLWLVTSLIMGTALSMLGTYTTLLFLPVFSFISAQGLYISYTLISRTRMPVMTLLTLFLIASLGFTELMNIHWLMKIEPLSENRKWMNAGTVAAGEYLKTIPEQGILSVDRRIGMQVRAVTDYRVLPYTDFLMELWVFDHIDPTLQSADFELTPSMNTNYFWALQSPVNPKNDWARLVQSNIEGGDSLEIISRYDIGYVLANEKVDYMPYYPRWEFYKDVFNSSNKIYDNSREGIWELSPQT